MDPQESRLSEWNLEIVGGFIFISKAPSFSINDQIGEEVINILNQIGKSLADVRSYDELDYASSWLISVENALSHII